ncbi:MAG: orotidine-5'-phosphate decarboxylase [Candidatus Berkelbacteria bacterium]|nr:orotidine-5'-phosphate decarboxylase [Candidatus Berkelbacteria bacterium]
MKGGEKRKMSFVERYQKRVAETNSVLCVGLDPTPEHLPPVFNSATSEGLLRDTEEYLRTVIAIAAERVPVIKPQYAYYGAMGPDGIAMIPRLTEYAHSLGLLVILDGKRGDIGETMEQYGNEVFGQYGVDACTFIPYLGSTFMPTKGTQSWMPWLVQGRCVISMIRTSNPEAEQLQDLELKNGLRVYEQVAMLVKEWNEAVREQTEGKGCVGGVVGATWPEQAPRCRELAGDDVFFLIPGYGAQGGGAKGAVSGLRNSRSEVMGTVNSSRGITRDSWRDRETGQPKPGDPMELVVAAIDAANSDLNQFLAA